MLDELIEEAGRHFDLADRGVPLVEHLLEMITDRDHGLIQGFLTAFREEGMDAQVDSWVADGPGEALSGAQVETGLGPGLVEEIAQRVDLDVARVAPALGFLIPRILDALTPGGQVPDEDSLLTRVAALRAGAGAAVPAPAPAPPPPAPRAAPAVEASDESARRIGAGRWLLPLIVLLALGWWAAKQCAPESPADGDPPRAAASSATALDGEESDLSVPVERRVADGAAATLEPESPAATEPDRDVATAAELDSATTAAPSDAPDPEPDTATADADADANADANAEEGVAAVADLAPDFTTEQLVATLNRGNLDFAPSSAAISAGGRALLEEAAQAILALPSGTRLEIAGHTDASGEPRRNQRLSQARAEAVRNVLIDYGVPSIMLSPRGYGSTRPVADNDTVAGRDRNRRIEFTVLEADGE